MVAADDHDADDDHALWNAALTIPYTSDHLSLPWTLDISLQVASTTGKKKEERKSWFRSSLAPSSRQGPHPLDLQVGAGDGIQ
jgi:hypothetical protein